MDTVFRAFQALAGCCRVTFLRLAAHPAGTLSPSLSTYTTDLSVYEADGCGDRSVYGADGCGAVSCEAKQKRFVPVTEAPV